MQILTELRNIRSLQRKPGETEFIIFIHSWTGAPLKDKGLVP